MYSRDLSYTSRVKNALTPLKEWSFQVKASLLKLLCSIKEKVKEISDLNLDFTDQRNKLQTMFLHLKELSDKTDKSFTGAVLAQEKKQLNGLDHLEKRLLKAQKRKYKEIVKRITNIQQELFPKQSLQERQANFSEFYEIYGDELIPLLVKALDPLKLEFYLISPEA